MKREYKIGPYYADGFDPVTRTVYEYWGCWYHGCDKCHSPDDIICHGQRASVLKEKTERKRRYYDKRGFHLTEVWGCDSMLASDYIRERRARWHVILSALNLGIRDSLCGGRTENFKLFFDPEITGHPETRLRYVDFTSLYPFVLKRKAFPIGHPTLITKTSSISLTSILDSLMQQFLPLLTCASLCSHTGLEIS